MQVVEAFGLQDIYTNTDGSARAILSKSISAALAARVMKLYLWVESVDANVEVQVFWGHSADGVNWYKEDSTAIVDTGAGADASKRMYVGDTGQTIFGAYVRLQLVIKERTAGTVQLTG